MQIFRRQSKLQLLKALVFLGVACFLVHSHKLHGDVQTQSAEYATMLRWGRPEPDSRSEEITLRLAELFNSRATQLNFSKRNLTSLLEEAFPRRLGRLFPFRTVAYVPSEFFFENFAPFGFLVGELNTRVPPLLSETKTADWLELRSNRPIESLRELTPHVTLQRGLRALSLQSPWANEVFSTLWETKFESAVEIIESGGVQCMQAQQPATSTSKISSPKPAQQALPPHFRCSKPSGKREPDAGIPKQLPRKIGPVGTDSGSVTSNTPPSQPACLPAGRLQSQALELIGDEKAGHCFLWRASLDERFHQRTMRSKLICLNAKYKSFQKTRFNNVVAVIPSARDDQVNIIEAEDGLLTSYRISLATLSVKKNEIFASSGQNLRNSQFPRNRTGLYACKSPASTSKTLAPFASPMLSASHLEWVYLDDAIYSGLRQARPETDVAWRLREVRDGVIDAEKLSWSQLKYDHPSVTAEPSFTCATYRSMDATCALRVLQTSLQVSEEFLKGYFDSKQIDPQIQLSVATIIGQSLEKVTKALPDWALNNESQSLLSFFLDKAHALAKQVEGSEVSGVTFNINGAQKLKPKYYDVDEGSQDYLAIKYKIFSASDFWATLKQKPL